MIVKRSKLKVFLLHVGVLSQKIKMNRNGGLFIGYVLSVLTMAAFSGLEVGSLLLMCIDLPSVIILLILCVPVLLSAGLFRDFNNAFAIALSKKKIARITEMKRAMEAVDLTMKTLLFGGGFIFIFSLIIVLRNLEVPEMLGPNIAVAMLTFIYAIGFNIILLPIKSKLNIRMTEFMQD